MITPPSKIKEKIVLALVSRHRHSGVKKEEELYSKLHTAFSSEASQRMW